MNNKIKSLWMAQYLGQKILTGPNVIGGIAELRWGHLNFKYDHELPLLLRTVDMLTDEEKKIFGDVWPLDKFVSDFNGLYIQEEFWHPASSWEICQYLLCIGILLPFTYLNESNQPVTLTPDEIVKLGWAKIKTV